MKEWSRITVVDLQSWRITSDTSTLDEGMMQDYCSNSADMKDYFWYFTTVGRMIQDYCSRSAVMKDYFWYFNLDEGMMQDYCSISTDMKDYFKYFIQDWGMMHDYCDKSTITKDYYSSAIVIFKILQCSSTFSVKFCRFCRIATRFLWLLWDYCRIL